MTERKPTGKPRSTWTPENVHGANFCRPLKTLAVQAMIITVSEKKMERHLLVGATIATCLSSLALYE